MLDEVAAAVRETNLLIERRAFSWTDFFNRIETTLPPDVMLTEVSPDIEPGSIEVTMGVLGRRLDDINEFIDALEESGAFTGGLERRSEITEDGMYRAVLVGQWLQGVPPGDPEADATDDRLANGVPVENGQYEEMRARAVELGVEVVI